jgi:hypothetical protein
MEMKDRLLINAKNSTNDHAEKGETLKPTETVNLLTEEMVQRYYELSQRAKELDNELTELKTAFHMFFDNRDGIHSKGEVALGDYKIQRQIREYESFQDERTVKALEKMNLNDCIKLVKIPDYQKIEAAVTLGIISMDDFEGCLNRKVSKAIVVKKASLT